MPAALDAVTFRCTYCGREQQVPDLEARRRLLLEEQREARLRALQEQQHARELREEQREANERARERRRRPFTWLAGLIPMLLAPAIIAVTVFDAPARLGFGASGSDRLEQYVTQMKATGCTIVKDVDAEYANSTVSKLVPVAANQCLRVMAAGGPGHSSLTLMLFNSEGRTVATAASSLDPRVDYCARAAETLRFELGIGPAAKGRLSTVVLACPANEPALPATEAPATKKKR
ncbi:MAG: hypothetical protein SFX73_14650 [Kofleriaceae bacterium]|nr:hypothetical protein [Kofleriaceae bacterium]